MKAYLERAKQHKQFIAEKTYEFQIGKRHLANMMGENPETFTQEDVNVENFKLLVAQSLMLLLLFLFLECY